MISFLSNNPIFLQKLWKQTLQGPVLIRKEFNELDALFSVLDIIVVVCMVFTGWSPDANSPQPIQKIYSRERNQNLLVYHTMHFAK